MRQVLFHIPLDRSWNLGPLGEVPGFGFGIVLLAWALYGAWSLYARGRAAGWKLNLSDELISGAKWLAVAAVIVFGAPALGRYLHDHGTANFKDGPPIFGYGLMMCLGFLAATLLAAYRAEKEGLPGDVIWDLTVWLLIPGIVGARLNYLIQYPDKVFGNVPVAQWPIAALNLSQGGIILYGALLGGAAGYFTFCYSRKIRPLGLADIVVPSVFVGIGFGRIGCLLNGCCYGGFTSYPWGICFPRESTTFAALAEKGLIDVTAPYTPPLAPTQIFSSIDGFMLALITTLYFRYRRRNGEVLAVALVLYPISRFCMEFLRGDEGGQFGTTLTIAQWVSITLFIVNLGYIYYLSRLPAVREPLTFSQYQPGPRMTPPVNIARTAVSASKS